MPPSSRRISRRRNVRHPVSWVVDVRNGEHFLYASIANVSELGLFVSTMTPLPEGTELELRFQPLGKPALSWRHAPGANAVAGNQGGHVWWTLVSTRWNSLLGFYRVHVHSLA